MTRYVTLDVVVWQHAASSAGDNTGSGVGGVSTDDTGSCSMVAAAGACVSVPLADAAVDNLVCVSGNAVDELVSAGDAV